MSDRDLWLIIRRALLMIVHAIERRYLKAGVYDEPVECFVTERVE
jgi:hypothetical protein